MEIVIFLESRGETNLEEYSNHMVQYSIWGLSQYKLFSTIKSVKNIGISKSHMILLWSSYVERQIYNTDW